MIDRLAEEPFPDREPHLDVVAFHDRLGGRIGLRRHAARFGGKQVLGVVVLGVLEDLPRRSLLDDLALRHDADAVGDASDDAEIMSDEQHAHAVFGLQAGQQFEDLRLNGDVERRRRLVGDQELGPVGERHGDHHALALAAAQLVRIGVEPPLRVPDADLVEKVQRPLARPFPAHPLVQHQRLPDLLLDRVQRVERCHRLLEDHRDVIAANVAQMLHVGGQQIGAFEKDFAEGMAGRRIGQQLQDGIGGDALAGAGFADKRHRLALADIEADVVHGQRRIAALVEGDGEIADGEQGLGQAAASMSVWRKSSPLKSSD